jgi:uncharacterized protein (TIGR03118 family)
VRFSVAGVVAFAMLAVVLIPATTVAAEDHSDDNVYSVTALVSNNAALAPRVDPHLVNAWGLVAGPTTPWWVSDNGVDLSTLYSAAGQKIGLEVSVAGAPTGVVFNGLSTSFLIGTARARFIFSTESGTIAGWNGAGAARAMVDSSGAGAVYKGLAIASTSTGPRLYATDFHNGRVDVFNDAWGAVDTSGAFVDEKIPAGFAPFGIQTIGDRIFVTYAKQAEGAKDDVPGRGFGFVDAFDFAGNLLTRVARHGQLNAPWGLAMAPENFGRFSGDLLVGNFGDGQVNAYRENPDGKFQHVGTLRTEDGKKLIIDGLWALEFGNGAANNGPTTTLFFTAGPNGEADGLFGTISAVQSDDR